MIKLIVIARCIPEDVYLQSLESQKQILAGEKRFPIVVRDPEAWYIGRLAIEIKSKYESLYKRPFGQIKYLKDAEDDCDLDPESSVADLLVDEGKAAKDGGDQKRIVKVIQERGRALRQGSVIPDLTPSHYQPPTRPPVPKFPLAEKRGTEIQGDHDRQSKRRRLGQIEEESDQDIAHSIEGVGNGHAHGRRSPSHFELPDAHFLSSMNGRANLDSISIEPKQESPENARIWVNATPATTDELEYLPEQPANWRSRDQHRSVASSDLQRPGADHARTPVTPPISEHPGRTLDGQPVSLLNGMNAGSPAVPTPLTASATRFRGSRNHSWDVEESDIDDTQMSPRSRALRTKITPKLVRTSRSRDRNRTTTTSSTSHTSRMDSASRSTEADSNKENRDVPRLEVHKADDKSATSSEAPSRERDVFAALPLQSIAALKRPRQDSDAAQGSSEESSVQDALTKRKRKKSKESEDHSTGTASQSRSSSEDSSLRSEMSSRSGNYEDDDDDRDSAGAQLEESLRRSSPGKQTSNILAENEIVTPFASKQAQTSAEPRSKDQNYDEDSERSLDGNANDGGAARRLDAPKGSKPLKKLSSKRESTSGVRCYTCWAKSSLCDNKEPKCSTCEKTRKNCQYYRMTKEEAEKEKADRQAGRTKPPLVSTTYPPSSLANQLFTGSDLSQSDMRIRNSKAESVATPTTANSGTKTPKQQKEKRSGSDTANGTPAGPSESYDKDSNSQSSLRQVISDSQTSNKPEKQKKGEPKNDEVVLSTPYQSQATPVNARPVNQQMPKKSSETLPVPSNDADLRERSPNTILPPGMTQEEYDRLINARKDLTPEQWKQQKLAAKKEGQKDKRDQRASLPAAKAGTPDQTSNKKEKEIQAKKGNKRDATTASSDSNSSGQSTQSASTKPSASPAPLQPERPTPIPSKPKPASPADSATKAKTPADSKSKLANYPTVATTASSVNSKKHTNPPFRQPQQRKSAGASTTVAPLAVQVPTIATSKSLKDVRAALSSRNSSSASTPQPISRLAAFKRQAEKSKESSLGSDDDDDDDDEDESETESSSDDQTESSNVTTATSGKDTGKRHEPSKVIMRQRSLEESGSGGGESVSSSESESEDEGDLEL